MKAHFLQLAAYNTWANERVYAVAGQLSTEEFTRDLKAFFRSVQGTLNHILVADLIWLGRFEGVAAAGISRLDDMPHAEFAALSAARRAADARLRDLVEGLEDADFDRALCYRNMAGAEVTNRRSDVLTHVFNHQTHHRGQTHGLLTQLGREAPALDLIYYINTRA